MLSENSIAHKILRCCDVKLHVWQRHTRQIHPNFSGIWKEYWWLFVSLSPFASFCSVLGKLWEKWLIINRCAWWIDGEPARTIIRCDDTRRDLNQHTTRITITPLEWLIRRWRGQNLEGIICFLSIYCPITHLWNTIDKTIWYVCGRCLAL